MEKQNFWQKLYPTTKLWFGLGMIVLIFAATNYWLSALVFVVFLVLIARLGLMKQFKFVLVGMAILGLSLFSIQGIFNPANETVLFSIIPGTFLTFYSEGIHLAADLYCRILPLVASLFLMIRTTNMTDLGVALNRAGVSYKFNYVLVSTFQIIPVFQKEMNQIMNAQRARGLVTEGSVIRRFKAFVPIIVPLIANSIAKVQGKAIALESKGFNTPVKKTYYRELQRTGADTAVCIAAAVVAVGGLAYRILLVTGWL